MTGRMPGFTETSYGAGIFRHRRAHGIKSRLSRLALRRGTRHDLCPSVSKSLGPHGRTAVAGLRSDNAERFAWRPAVRWAVSFSPGHRARRRFARRFALGTRPERISPLAASEWHLSHGVVGDHGRQSLFGLLQKR